MSKQVETPATTARSKIDFILNIITSIKGIRKVSDTVDGANGLINFESEHYIIKIK